MYQIALLLLVTVSGGLSQIVVNGPCPIRSGSTGIFNHINGTWYQIERIPNSEEIGSCSMTSFIIDVTGRTMSNRKIVSQRVVFHNGTITRPNSEPYRFTVTFHHDLLPKDYYLVGTDFVNYALIARCQDTTKNNVTTTSLYAWKLSRSSSLTVADTVFIDQHLEAISALARANWRFTNHSIEACRASSAGSLVPSLALVAAVLLFKGRH